MAEKINSVERMPRRRWRKIHDPHIAAHDEHEVRRAYHRRRHEARLRHGVAIFPTPLGTAELDCLIELGWLPPSKAADRTQVGLALAAVIREMTRR